MKKIQTSIRLSQKAKDMVRAISEQMGVTQSGVLEIAIREMAVRKGVK